MPLLCPALLASEDTDVSDTSLTLWALPPEAPGIEDTDGETQLFVTHG